MLFTADFETTTDPEDCRVWAWAICEIGNVDNFIHGTTIDSFFTYLQKGQNSTYYFHNLKFDGAFIISYLLRNGFRHVKDNKGMESKTFTTLISDMGQFYTIEVVFKRGTKYSKRAKFIDSLKIINLPVSDVAKAFKLPISKLEIDYKATREIGHSLTAEEIEYIRNDVEIMARALQIMFDQDLKKITLGSNAMYDFKKIIGEKRFTELFPPPYYDKDVRQAYKGGFTYVPDEYKSKDLESGLVLDVNSLYPWVLHDMPLPYQAPLYFEGAYEYDKIYPLSIQMIRCQFELKDGYIPTIQIKGNRFFVENQYLKTSDRILPDGSTDTTPVTMCLTNVDIELLFEHYHVYNPEYLCGWKFRASTEIFKPYIDKWAAVKEESTRTGNKAMRTIAKLMLNNLYGKFSTAPEVRSKIPYLDNNIVKYRVDPPYKEQADSRDPVYIPVGIFVTSWARYKTIKSAQKVYKYFRYADTDSLHLEMPLCPELSKLSSEELEKLTTDDLRRYGVDLPEDFEIDPVKLGAWKVESKFTRARFLRQKSYIEDSNATETWNTEKFSTSKVKEYCKRNNINFDEEIKKYKGCYDTDLLKITCAGMPKTCYDQVSWDNFKLGATYHGKLQPKTVEGGTVLVDIDFTIKP